MTHNPDFGAKSRRRKSAPTSALCVIPIWYQIFLVPDSADSGTKNRPETRRRGFAPISEVCVVSLKLDVVVAFRLWGV